MTSNIGFMGVLLNIALFTLFAYFFIKGLKFLIHGMTPDKTIKTLSKCILKTLKEMGEIESEEASIKVATNKDGLLVLVTLVKATEHEKSVFSKAVSEMFSSIDNPRYVIVKNFLKRKMYSQSYACPSIIGSKKENVDILVKYLKKVSGKYFVTYTRSETGRIELLKCRKHSLININDSIVFHKKSATKWE